MVTPQRQYALQWRHSDHNGVSNHQPHGCLLNRLFRRRSKKTSMLRVTRLCVGNSPGPVNSPHKGPVTRKMFSFNDVIMSNYYVTRCRINENLRVPLWNKIKITQPDFSKLDDKGKFCYLMSNSDPRTLSWFGKYVYQSFNVRNEKVYGNQWFKDFFPFANVSLVPLVLTICY